MAASGRSRRNRWRIGAIVALLLALAVAAPSCIVGYVGGAFDGKPADLPKGLSPAASKLVTAAFEGIDRRRLLDHHVHIAGLGTHESGCSINPELTSWLHPIKRMRYAVYLSASGVTDTTRSDKQFVDRLVDLVRHHPGPGRYILLPFDRYHLADGSVDHEHTEFHVPDAWVQRIARKHPDLFMPAISVHPYRKDALAALERGAAAGGRLVKWLPNAMGIDPANPRCDAFYDKMKQLGLVLLSHAGEEKAVEADNDQKLGNPLRLRRPLDRGVRVIVAHCASLGDNVDLDNPKRGRVANFDLFLRLMGEKRYQGLVFGEISATTLFNRMDSLRVLLSRTDLHGRLVNGSDYPLPAINILIRTGRFADQGIINAAEREALNEIYNINPLLFDLVLKRTIRDPKTSRRFSAEVFMDKPALGLTTPATATEAP